MDLAIVPFLTYVLVTTYTPGPNNISSASMGVWSVLVSSDNAAQRWPADPDANRGPHESYSSPRGSSR